MLNIKIKSQIIGLIYKVREIPAEPEIQSMYFVSVAACLLISVQTLLTALQAQRHKIYQSFWRTFASFFPEFIFITKSCYYTCLKLTRKFTKHYYIWGMVNKHSSPSDLHSVFWYPICLTLIGWLWFYNLLQCIGRLVAWTFYKCKEGFDPQFAIQLVIL